MRLKAYITAMLLAVVSLLAMPLVPHHHHGSEICLHLDSSCSSTCDHHEHKHGDEPSSHDACVEKSDCVIAKTIDVRHLSHFTWLFGSADTIPTLKNPIFTFLIQLCDFTKKARAVDRIISVRTLRSPPATTGIKQVLL